MGKNKKVNPVYMRFVYFLMPFFLMAAIFYIVKFSETYFGWNPEPGLVQGILTIIFCDVIGLLFFLKTISGKKILFGAVYFVVVFAMLYFLLMPLSVFVFNDGP